jgi:translation initiation factor 3 subunit J
MARLRRTEKDSDLKHAENLFGDIDLNRNRGSPKAVVVGDASDPTKAIDLSAMPLFKPTTKDQFATLTNVLIPLLTANTKKVQYSLWAPEFAKQLVNELPSDQIKKVASALTTLSNQKMREEKAAEKGSKKSKAAKTKSSLVTQRDVAKVDTSTYEDDLGDDDFM